MRVLAVLLLCSALFFMPAAAFAAQDSSSATLLFLADSGALRVAEVTDEGVRVSEEILAPGYSIRRFLVSPKGDRVLFDTGSELALLDLHWRRVFPLGAGLEMPGGQAGAFSPDGERLALRRRGHAEVHLFSASGQRQRVLAIPGLQDGPGWLWDSRRLAVSMRGQGGTRVYLYDAQSGNRLAVVLQDPESVRFHPEGFQGRRLLVREVREGVAMWWAVSESGARDLVDEPAPKGLPADLPAGVDALSSPCGKWIAYLDEGVLCVRPSAVGSEPARLGPASAIGWKAGGPLAARPVVVVNENASRPQAIAPGRIALSVSASEALEGQPLDITWQVGAGVAQVQLSAVVQRSLKGGAGRGTYTVPIARVAATTKQATWQVPWLDNLTFVLRAEALNSEGLAIGRVDQKLAFRPKELAEERRDGIFVHLSNPERQRLYVQEKGRLTAVYLCSGSSTGRLLPANLHPDDPHDHYGEFRVLDKDPDHVSNLDDDWKMPYAMRYLNGHFIHVTARNQYRRLGRPGSHGCVRLHHQDGFKLYGRTPMGSLVVIY